MADDAAVRMYLGENSDPCCMNAPSENHRLLNIVKSLVKLGPVGVSSNYGGRVLYVQWACPQCPTVTD